MEPFLQWGLEVIRAVQQVQSPLLNGFFFTVSGLGSSFFLFLVLPALFWCVDYRLGMRVAVVCTLSAFCNSSLVTAPAPCSSFMPKGWTQCLAARAMALHGLPTKKSEPGLPICA